MEDELLELGKAALSYLRMGYAVLPLKARSKVPSHSGGVREAWAGIEHEGDVIAWWTMHPGDNIGIAAGMSNLVIIDVDNHDVDGNMNLMMWERDNHRLPETVSVCTPTGGMHYYYKCSEQIGPSKNTGEGIDVRGGNSYVVAPPSVHPSGGKYEWENEPSEHPLAVADESVFALINHLTESKTGKAQGGLLSYEVHDGEHSGRNEDLFRFGCSRQTLCYPDDDVRLIMVGADALRNHPRLPQDELERTIESVLSIRKGRSDDLSIVLGPPGSQRPDLEQVKEEQKFLDKKRVKTNVMAQLLIEYMHCCKIDGAPAVWTGKRWDIGRDAIENACLDIYDGTKTTDRNEVYSYVCLRAPDRDSSSFDERPYVQFSNGTWSIRDSKFVTPEPSMLITNEIDIAYDPDARCDDLDELMDRISAGDEATKREMYEVVAACMTSGHIVNQSAFLLGMCGVTGNASNGKSTFIDMIRNVIGNKNTSSLSIAELSEHFQAAMIMNKLANLGDDIPNDALRGSDLEKFKKIVTSNTIYTDIKGSRGFNFKPTATLVFSMNETPFLGDSSSGTIRRIAVVPFRRVFRPTDPDYDPNIGEKIKRPDFLAALAARAMQVAPALSMRGKFTMPDDAARVVEAMRENSDPFLRWEVDNDITPNWYVESSLSRAEQYAVFARWCIDNRITQNLGKNKFTRLVQDRHGAMITLLETTRCGKRFSGWKYNDALTCGNTS